VSAVAAERGVAVAGDVVGSVIATGDHATINLHIGSLSGSELELLRATPPFRALPLPIRDRPARKPDHVGRNAETARLFRGERIVSVYGEAGIGKTYLLAHAGWSDAADAVRDGVVYIFARGKTRVELLQELFEAFHETDGPLRRSERQLQRDLAEHDVLVLLDAVDLDGEELQALAGTLASARVVVAAEERRLWEGGAVALRGLPVQDAVLLVKRELGRELERGEQEDAEALCAALDGHPGRIRRAVAESIVDGRSLAETIRAPEPPLRLSDEERSVVAALAGAGGERVGAALLSRLADVPDLEAVVANLERRRLVTAHSPRWSLAPGVAEAVAPAPRATRTGSVTTWVERQRTSPWTVVEQATPLLALLLAARGQGRDEQVIRLGRALAPALAWGRRWDAWEEVIRSVLAAARRTGGRDAEGWALNERGAWAFTVGDTAQARDALLAALTVREQLGERQDLAVTRHNLEVVTGGPPPPTRPGRNVPRWLLPLAAALVAAGVVAGAAAWGILSAEPPAGDPALAVQVEGPGRVLSEPGGIDCPGACEAQFAEEAEVVLAAVPDEGAEMARWEGDCAGAVGTTCRLTVGEAHSARAVFVAGPGVPAVGFELGIVAEGGRVRSEPEGIDCPGQCSATYDAGATVRLIANANDGLRFAGWKGACEDDPDPVCELTVDRDLTVVARFEALPGEMELRVNPPVGGRITSEPRGIACPERCAESFPEGTEVVLTATWHEGFAFAAWTGDCDNGDEPVCTLTLEEPRSVGARFDPIAGDEDTTVPDVPSIDIDSRR